MKLLIYVLFIICIGCIAVAIAKLATFIGAPNWVEVITLIGELSGCVGFAIIYILEITNNEKK